MTQSKIDQKGKASFTHIYDQETPSDFYLKFAPLSYIIADVARSPSMLIYEHFMEIRSVPRISILDVACSYGINAAIQRFHLSSSELQGRYAALPNTCDRLIEADRVFFSSRRPDERLSFIGQDIAHNAISYAQKVGLLSESICVDFERNTELEPCQKAILAPIDIVLATGAVGYVTEKTLIPIVKASANSPWIVSFVLRQIEYRPVEENLNQLGYVTEKLKQMVFPQRRFFDAEEKNAAVQKLNQMGKPLTPLEKRGWHAAELYLSRPVADVQLPLSELIDSDVLSSVCRTSLPE
ncbi:MAG: class I SAM-dependent methyltransferase [Cyanobacteria bacterium P01_H01_bin.15]